MDVLDYRSLRDKLMTSLSEAGFRVSADEAVFLHSLSRGCDIYVYPVVGSDIWAKIGFEWTAVNQVLVEQFGDELTDIPVDMDDMDAEAAQVAMHCEFHLHFGALAISTEVLRDVATTMKQHAELYFGNEGGVVAEVYLTSDDAKLDCLRYEVNTCASLLAAEPWWNRWRDIVHGLLGKLANLYVKLETEFGPARN